MLFLKQKLGCHNHAPGTQVFILSPRDGWECAHGGGGGMGDQRASDILSVTAIIIRESYVNPSSHKFYNLNGHLLEVVSRFRDPQLQVGTYLFNLRPVDKKLQIAIFIHTFQH